MIWLDVEVKSIYKSIYKKWQAVISSSFWKMLELNKLMVKWCKMELNHWWRDSGKSNQRQEFKKRVFPHSSLFRGSVLPLTVSYAGTHPGHQLFSNLGASKLLRGLVRTHTSLDSHLSFWHPTPGEGWVTSSQTWHESHDIDAANPRPAPGESWM